MAGHENSQRLPTETKEKLITKFSSLTISGRSGTGKTVVAEKLAAYFSIPKERNFKTGQLIREITNSGQQSQGFMDRSMDIDEMADDRQRQLIVNATLAEPIMLEGRLAGVIASEEKQKNKTIKAVSILFVAPSEIRMARILKRHLNDHTKQILNLQKDINEAYLNMTDQSIIYKMLQQLEEDKGEIITLETVRKNEAQREAKDLERWQKLHPQLTGIDPFNPANRDKNKQPIYDLIIETGTLSVDQVVEEIKLQLKKNNFTL